MASGSTYVAIVGRNGKLLSSRFQNLRQSVKRDRSTVGASAALAAATEHARNTPPLLGRGGAPDALRVVVRDSRGTVVRVIDGDITRGDIAVD